MSDPVTYTAVLPLAEETVQFVSGLLAAERQRRGTRGRRRVLGCYRQAVLVLRWFLDGTRLAQLAADHGIGVSTAYRYLHEGIDALAAAAPGLRGALLAARANTPATAAPCRSSPPRTAGRCGPRACGPADLGYEGERAALTTPIKKTPDALLTDDQRTVNLLHAATRAPAERGNSLLKTTFKALRRVSHSPRRSGAITAAALVLLHHEQGRTT